MLKKESFAPYFAATCHESPTSMLMMCIERKGNGISWNLNKLLTWPILMLLMVVTHGGANIINNL